MQARGRATRTEATAAVPGGVVAGVGRASLPVMMVTVAAAAIVGDSVGYEVGRHLRGVALAVAGLVIVALVVRRVRAHRAERSERTPR